MKIIKILKNKLDKLYNYNQIVFVMSCILLYIIILNLGRSFSNFIGITEIVTAPLLLFITYIILYWIYKNDLKDKYGLFFTTNSDRLFLYYIPLIVVIILIFLYDITLIKYGIIGKIFYIITIICSSILEELFFKSFILNLPLTQDKKYFISISAINFCVSYMYMFNNEYGILMWLLQIICGLSIGAILGIYYIKTDSIIFCIIFRSIIFIISSITYITFDLKSTIVNLIIDVILLLYLMYLIFPRKRQYKNKSVYFAEDDLYPEDAK